MPEDSRLIRKHAETTREAKPSAPEAPGAGGLLVLAGFFSLLWLALIFIPDQAVFIVPITILCAMSPLLMAYWTFTSFWRRGLSKMDRAAFIGCLAYFAIAASVIGAMSVRNASLPVQSEHKEMDEE